MPVAQCHNLQIPVVHNFDDDPLELASANKPLCIRMNVKYEKFKEVMKQMVPDADDIDVDSVSSDANTIVQAALTAMGMSANLLTIATSVPVVGVVAGLVASVLKSVLKARTNKDDAASLGCRVINAWAALKPLLDGPKFTQKVTNVKPALESLQATLRRCAELMEKVNGKANESRLQRLGRLFLRVVHSSETGKELDELEDDLDKDQQQVMLALGVVQFQRQEKYAHRAEKTQAETKKELEAISREVAKAQQDMILKLGNTNETTLLAIKAVHEQQTQLFADMMTQVTTGAAAVVHDAMFASRDKFPQITAADLVFGDEREIHVSSDATGAVIEAMWMHEKVSVKVIKHEGALSDLEKVNFHREVWRRVCSFALDSTGGAVRRL
jgi:hypothetical protein